jgi:hypothetical protein
LEQALTAEEQERVESILPMLKVKMMARQITGNDHLEAILRDCEVSMRRGVYDLITPHLTFKSKSLLCMKFKKLKPRPKPAELKPVIVVPASGITVVKRAEDAK